MSAPPIPLQSLRDPVLLLATGFGSGLIRPAPGTWGTLPGIALAFGLVQLPVWGGAGLLVCLFLAGIPLCTEAGRRLGVEDHGGIVYDEIVGYAAAVIWFPFDALTVLVGFIAFRFFDIVKPWPVSWADRDLETGLGVMSDDLIAGLYAAATLWLAREGVLHWYPQLLA